MKRIVVFFASLFAALSIHAQTIINLEPSGCGLTRYCFDVANDADAQIALYDSPTAANLTLILNDVSYTGRNISPTVAYAVDGSWVTLTTSFSNYVTCTHSGRGQHCSLHWTLIGGTVTLP